VTFKVSTGTAAKGAGWVVAQFAAMALVLLVAGSPPQWPTWISLSGLIFVAAGAAWFALGLRALGQSLTVFPRPRTQGVLVEHGVYRFARHPMYGGGLLIFAGIGLASSVWSLLATALLALVWIGKSREEERLLAERFPAYAEYRRRVRGRFLPWL
jgi:protein-S-isoprenylcysteine O-methyltransferase Ste14